MNLIDENIEKESEEKQKKVTKLIIIAIAVLLAIVIVILIYSAIKKKNTLTLMVNGEKTNFGSSLFLMADKRNFKKSENGEIYISVRELTNILGNQVGYFNDEYNGKGEDVTKCHIKTDNEYTSYITGSSTIYKVRDNKAINEEIRKNNKNNKNDNQEEILVSDTEYEYFTIDNGVIYENNEIYATKSAIELGFNVKINYDEKNKTVSILTLDGLTQRATEIIGASVVSDNIAYYNKKLFKYGYALVKSAGGDYGIQDFESYQEGNYVLSCKYSDIKFIEGLSCLIVTTSEKNEKGILKPNAFYDPPEDFYERGVLFENGKVYEFGKVIEKDMEKAFEYYLRAAKKGYVKAQNKVGDMYYLGQGVKQDYNEALKWYQRAAAQGSVEGYNNFCNSMKYQSLSLFDGLQKNDNISVSERSLFDDIVKWKV